MSNPVIWLHTEALRADHPVFTSAPKDARAVYVWDDAALKKAGYSLKRLVFIYETLAELPVEILSGDTASVLAELAPDKLYVPFSPLPYVADVIDALGGIEVETIKEPPFATVPEDIPYKRFFKYWNKAEKTALQPDGGA